jgi:hypothetical protein
MGNFTQLKDKAVLAALQKLWRKVFKAPEDLVAFPEVFENFQELLQGISSSTANICRTASMSCTSCCCN